VDNHIGESEHPARVTAEGKTDSSFRPAGWLLRQGASTGANRERRRGLAAAAGAFGEGLLRMDRHHDSGTANEGEGKSRENDEPLHDALLSAVSNRRRRSQRKRVVDRRSLPRS
jgi:hypothetical protein